MANVHGANGGGSIAPANGNHITVVPSIGIGSFLPLFVERQPSSVDRSTRLAPWQLRRVIELVENGLDSAISVMMLAEAARLGSSRFSRLFRMTSGVTPYAYVMSRRIERSKALMLETQKPLSEIALDTGFADQAHFSRVFKASSGMNPLSWRRSNAMKAVEKTVPCS